MKIRTTCLLPDTFLIIDFNDHGVYNYCRSFQGMEHQEELEKRYWEKLLATHRGRSDYEILMAYSGGRNRN
jgi:hypothetical protein